MSRHRLGVFLLIAGLALVHLWLIASGRWPLSPDEAHYWDWSRHLDWSYYSKGPMVAYLIALGTALGGPTAFGVRLPAVVLSAGLALLAFRLARRLFGSDRPGLLTVAFLSVMPLYAAGALLMTIDVPFICCWGLAAALLLTAVERRSYMAWYGVGLAFGLGLLSKYTMAMLVPCVFLWLASSARLRPWLLRREPYEAMLIGLLLFSPVLVWNARHGWLSGRHVLIQAAGSGRPDLAKALVRGPEFLGSQLALVSPLLFCVLAVGLAWAWEQGVRHGRDDCLLLVCLSVPVLLFFQVWSVVTKVQANWAAHAYLTAAVAAAGWCESWAARSPKSRQARRRLKLLVLASIILPAVALPVALFPGLLTPFGARLPAALDLVGKRLHGWPELGQAVGAIAGRLPRPPFLMSDRYQVASELAFYVPGQPRVYNANLGRRMNQYDLWGGWEALRGQDGLFVGYGAGDPPPELVEAFGQVERLTVVPISQRGQHLRDFVIFWGRDFRGFPPRPFEGY
ncbi:MAG TPA: glycosyltransferase family 39 protein [Candidatus Sulfotelmatobacter sp.]|nr:glycosyltransferase family 39 protein [Candidatus Sulfotelmatobacter sp.]